MSGRRDTRTNREDLQVVARAYLVMVRTVLVHDLDNQAAKEPVEQFSRALRQLFAAGQHRVQIRTFADLAYVNGSLVRLDRTLFAHLQQMARLWDKLKLREIEFARPMSAEELRPFLVHLREAAREEQSAVAFHGKTFDAIQVRDVVETEAPTIQLSETMRAVRIYVAAVITLKLMVQALEERQNNWIPATKKAIQDLVSATYANEALLLSLRQLPYEDGKLFRRLANSAVLTAVLCSRLGIDRVTAAGYALNAAVHDLDWTGNGDRVPTVRQLARIYRGDAIGHQRLAVAAELDNPKGMPAAWLVSVAAAYERLTTLGENGKLVPPDEALRRVESKSGELYHPEAVRLLVGALGVFPAGAQVELSDGSLAVVVELPNDGRALDAPKVKLLHDAGGGAADGRVIDLAKEPSLSILRAVPAAETNLNPAYFFLG